MEQSEATIYLAGRRTCTYGNQYRSFLTFKFENDRCGKGILSQSMQLLNDVTLREGGTLLQSAGEDSIIILLPVVGGLKYKAPDEDGAVEVEEAGSFAISKGDSYEVFNPHQENPINYLQINLPANKNLTTGKNRFNLDRNKNEVQPLFPGDRRKLQTGFFPGVGIGMFDGRREGLCKFDRLGQAVFIFVIEGAFEVQNRLLQPRDGLALWKADVIEFEALSNDAILLIVRDIGN